MDFGTFINNNWQMIGGMISFVFLAGIFYSRITSNQKEYSRLREQDYKDFEQQLKQQKETHDDKITDVTTRLVAVETKVEELKDKTFQVISSIQQDIREIMTILKKQ